MIRIPKYKWIRHYDRLFIGNKTYHLYQLLRRLKFIKGMEVKANIGFTKCLEVPDEVADAIELFETNKGYGGMHIVTYLTKLFKQP